MVIRVYLLEIKITDKLFKFKQLQKKVGRLEKKLAAVDRKIIKNSTEPNKPEKSELVKMNIENFTTCSGY